MSNSGAATTRRLHGLLFEAIRETRGDDPDDPVTVAEIYQDLVPYRDVKDELGLGLNADYEYAVLRLLAGTDGDVRVEPEEVRARLGAELESPNPDVGLFRQFAACDVRVGGPPVRLDAGSAGPDGAEAASDTGAENGGSGGRREAEAGDDLATANGGESAVDCVYCGRTLPTGRAVHFCPFCGGDQARHPCGSCGEPLEDGWVYCIACGTAVASA